jgi:isopropylmalate/homocitrate/citramalate synthase
LVEGWGSFQKVLKNLVRMVKLAKSYGIQVMAFTENLSITTPSHVEKYVISACAAGADWVGIADTAGRLFPSGSASLTRFVAKTILRYRQNTHDHRKIGIVFHGHNDLGNATNNSIAALSAGASVIDVVTNGLGERVGNTNLNEMVVNYEYRLRMHPANGHEKNRFDLTKLKSLSETYARITGSSLEMRQPVVGHSVFSTHFGIHANYYYKVALLVEKMHKARYSQKLINQFLKEAWKVYSAASPADFNSEPDVRVSPFSGASNVILRLKQMRLIDEISSVNKTDSRVQRILSQAKKGWGELPDRDILWLWNSK